MKNKTKHIIKTIEPGSIAEELELEPGDELLRVNGEIIEDVFDYHFQTNDTYLELTIRKKDGEEWDLEIEKEYDEEIGITFENEFMDQYRSCSNNCIFCFITSLCPVKSVLFLHTFRTFIHYNNNNLHKKQGFFRFLLDAPFPKMI